MTTKSYYVCSYAKHDYGFHTLRSCRSTKETYAFPIESLGDWAIEWRKNYAV